MSWNYRIMAHKSPSGEDYVGLHSVHYNEKDEIWAWSKEPEMAASDPDELLAILETMISDTKKSKDKILDYNMEPEGSFDVPEDYTEEKIELITFPKIEEDLTTRR